MNKVFLIGAILLFGIQVFGQLSEQHYKVYQARTGREVSLQELAADMKNYDVLLFGEEHNDSVAHHLEHRILELLFQEYKNNLALSLEMFERDVQLVMNEYLSGSIREKILQKMRAPGKTTRITNPWSNLPKPINSMWFVPTRRVVILTLQEEKAKKH
ncbi:MAG: ChaN family lipoprotein [Saprospiraceae bacterium]|nr:ChaN family lipoprotein [Saprospiraceae bacterium]